MKKSKFSIRPHHLAFKKKYQKSRNQRKKEREEEHIKKKMADVLTDALHSLECEGESLLTKSHEEDNFIEKTDGSSQFSIDASQKSSFDFEVNLQPEKIVEVASLPVGNYNK